MRGRMARLMVLIMVVAALWGCQNGKIAQQNEKLKKQVKELKNTISLIKQTNRNIRFLKEQLKGVKARIKTNYGDIEVSFYPEKAPLHVFNFICRAESGFFNGTQFHRIVPGFVIQGGDPLTRGKDKSRYGTGGPIVNIPNEFNDLPHVRGVLSMARTSDPNAGAGSQFFITLADVHQLDHQYTVFGKVTKGMDVVDKIARVKRDKRDVPLKAVKILTVEVYR